MCVVVVVLLGINPVLAQDALRQPIRESAERAAAAAASQPAQPASASHQRGKLFWPGIALGAAGATTAALGLTVFRVEDSSAGNSPKTLYQDCVTQAATNPVYASNDCNALKAKNVAMLWTGAAIGAAGAAMIIGSLNTTAQIEPGGVRIAHRIRF
jgi:hypothetical protein